MTTMQINSHELIERLAKALNIAKQKQEPQRGVVRATTRDRDAQERFQDLFTLITFVETNRPLSLSVEDAVLINKYQS